MVGLALGLHLQSNQVLLLARTGIYLRHVNTTYDPFLGMNLWAMIAVTGCIVAVAWF